jgi:hypothetical protein
MGISNTIATVLILISPAGLIYGWFFYLTRIRRELPNWRNRVTFVSLGLASLAMILWPGMAFFMPQADWATGTGVAHQLNWAETWERAGLRILLGAFVLALFGRPRLILPIALACVGSALFWISSTMP